MATQATIPRLGRVRTVGREIADAFAEHGLLVYASAVSFRALIALVPLTLLGLAMMGALGLRHVWDESLAPAVADRVSTPVAQAIDFSVEEIFSSGGPGLIAFASALLLWDMTWAVNAVMQALNRIHDVEETRSWPRRTLTAVALAAAVSLCLVGAVLAVVAGPEIAGGVLDLLLGVGRWIASVALLLLAVGLLFRYAPAERPEVRWASGGSVFVIAVWIVASLGFRWWVANVADFESAVGNLTAFLILTAYVFTSAAIFLAGAQLDEFLRQETRKR
jgi:membrane protein